MCIICKYANNYYILCTTLLAYVYIAPSVPVVMATVLSSESIQISWSVEDDGGNPNLLYSLTQLTDRNPRVLLLSNSISEDGQYLVDHLIPNTSYQFSVVAHSNSGDSPQGWSIRVITNPCKYMFYHKYYVLSYKVYI